MSKTLWHTIQIKVPAEMLELTKAGKVSIKKTLTKTFNISKSQKKPAIKLIPADINKPQIVNDGKEWNVEELKSQMVKANALAKKNKGRDITKSEKRVSKLEKFKKAVVDSAREGVKKNIDKKYDELISSVKKMKSIKLKEKPKIAEKVLSEKTSLRKPTKEQIVENYKDLTKEEQSKILIKQLTVGKKPKKIDPDIFFDQLPVILSKSSSRALPLLVNLGFEPTDLTTMFGAKSFDFYPTPNKCLDEIYNKIPRSYQRELKLLEGTAGLGGVSYYFYKKGFEVTSNEFNTQLFDIMKKILPPEIKTTNNDFFDITQIKDDAIFLNPPFMKGVQLKFLLKALQLIRESKSKNKVKFIFFISPWLTPLIGEQYLTWNDIVKPKGQIQRTTFKLYVEELLGREINVNTVLDGDDDEFNDNFSFDLMTQLENECTGFGGTGMTARIYMIEIHD